MDYKDKQDWIEAVMASDLSPATKVYAFGIFKHMYGTKDESIPGAKRLKEATGLNDGHFYKYNQALRDAGFLEVTSRRGTSNEYRLVEVTSTGGRYLPPQAVGLPREAVGVTSTGGTNNTRKTTSKTTKEKTTDAAVLAIAPTTTSSLNHQRLEEGRETTTPSPNHKTDPPLDLTCHNNEVTATGGGLVDREAIKQAAVFRTEEELRERRQRILGRKG